MAVDICKLFNEELPAALAQNAEKAKEIGAKYQIIITGEGGGDWFIDVSSKGPRIEAGNPGGADCTVTISAEDFQVFYENPAQNGTQLFFQGKLKVTGNPMLGMKLQTLFDFKPAT
jgi:hypothetical protein